MSSDNGNLIKAVQAAMLAPLIRNESRANARLFFE